MNSIVTEQYPASFGQVAKFVELLERRGINRAEFQRAIDDPEVCDQIADAMRIFTIPSLTSDTVLHQAGINRTIRYQFGRTITRSERFVTGGEMWFSPTQGFEPTELFKPEFFRHLLLGMNDMAYAVLALRNGLDDGKEKPANTVAQRLGIETRTVATLLKKANRHMKDKQEAMFPLLTKRPYDFDDLYGELTDDRLDWSVVQYFGDSYSNHEMLGRISEAGITTVRELLELSRYQVAQLLLGPCVYLPQEHFPHGRIVLTS